MGNCCLPIRFRRTPSAVNPKNVTLLLLGLDNSGKTTIVKRLAGEPIDSVVPTVGFSVILLRQKGCRVAIYDLGGGSQIRDIWPRYYSDAHGLIFVTDSQDVEKMEECRQVLEKTIRNEKISGKPILLLANKQDVEGALDEIDIVDRLNLEELVNEQKCPTLVELCSALNFSKKMDLGIENGYRWLIRSIIRDYPSLNSRVLRDLAEQEEENKIEVIKEVKSSEETEEMIFNHLNGKSFKPVKILEEKDHANGYVYQRKRRSSVKTNDLVIPGLIDELPGKTKYAQNSRIRPLLDEETAPSTQSPPANSHSSEFFVLEKFHSDLKLLNEVANHTFKNFLVRPKSSGARLYGVKSEKKRTHRRKPLRKVNKTRPSLFTDISNGPNGHLPTGFYSGRKLPGEGEVNNLPSKNSLENVNPFLAGNAAKSKQRCEFYEMKTVDESKSVPNSRRNSMALTKKRRHSLLGGRIDGFERFNVSCGYSSTREILLDVTKINN